jgi:uncharacterized protein (TIGR02594 family)
MKFSRDFKYCPWMRPAIACYGVHGPPNDTYVLHALGSARAGTPAVSNFFDFIKDGHYGDDWCAAFVNWCLHEAKIPKAPNSSGARNFLTYGKPAPPTWGCITVIYRGKHTATTKHVGFLVEQTKDTVLILGGNQRTNPHKDTDHEVKFSHWRRCEVEAFRWPEHFPIPVETNTGVHTI